MFYILKVLKGDKQFLLCESYSGEEIEITLEISEAEHFKSKDDAYKWYMKHKEACDEFDYVFIYSVTFSEIKLIGGKERMGVV